MVVILIRLETFRDVLIAFSHSKSRNCETKQTFHHLCGDVEQTGFLKDFMHRNILILEVINSMSY